MTPIKNYYRIMLGPKSVYADECFKGEYIGAGWLGDVDLSGSLPENWRDFNKQFIPIYLKKAPGKSKVSAGLACGMLWTACRGIEKDDIVLCPDGKGKYLVGEVIEDYSYFPGDNLPHHRKVQWYPKPIERSNMSLALQNSTGWGGTVSKITKHSDEIESLLAGNSPPKLISTDELVEDPSVFALEEHLEDFLIQNWANTELGKNYNIFE